jgi:hypothetical protein
MKSSDIEAYSGMWAHLGATIAWSLMKIVNIYVKFVKYGFLVIYLCIGIKRSILD